MSLQITISASGLGAPRRLDPCARPTMNSTTTSDNATQLLSTQPVPVDIRSAGISVFAPPLRPRRVLLPQQAVRRQVRRARQLVGLRTVSGRCLGLSSQNVGITFRAVVGIPRRQTSILNCWADSSTHQHESRVQGLSRRRRIGRSPTMGPSLPLRRWGWMRCLVISPSLARLETWMLFPTRIELRRHSHNRRIPPKRNLRHS
jgi:hypothetical protein